MRPARLFLAVAVGLGAACHDSASTAPEPRIAPPALCCGWSASSYTVTVLPLPTGSWIGGRATDINSANRILGYVSTANGFHRPVRWLFGQPAFMPFYSRQHSAIPHGGNLFGDAVGQQQLITSQQTGPLQPVRWLSDGTVQALSTLGFDGVALDINDSRIAVGYSRASSAEKAQAVRWDETGWMNSLHPSFATESRAEAINNDGEILGTVVIGGVRHAWKWQPDNSMVDLGVAATARAINATGEAAGSAIVNGLMQAVLWSANGTVSAVGAGPNSVLRVVGDSHRVAGSAGTTPFTRLGGAITTLPLPGGMAVGTPTAINACGRIVGHASNGTLATEVPVQWTAPLCDP